MEGWKNKQYMELQQVVHVYVDFTCCCYHQFIRSYATWHKHYTTKLPWRLLLGIPCFPGMVYVVKSCVTLSNNFCVIDTSRTCCWQRCGCLLACLPRCVSPSLWLALGVHSALTVQCVSSILETLSWSSVWVGPVGQAWWSSDCRPFFLAKGDWFFYIVDGACHVFKCRLLYLCLCLLVLAFAEDVLSASFCFVKVNIPDALMKFVLCLAYAHEIALIGHKGLVQEVCN